MCGNATLCPDMLIFRFSFGSRTFAIVSTIGLGFLLLEFLDDTLFLTALEFIIERSSKHVESTQSVGKNSNGGTGHPLSVHEKLRVAFYLGIIVRFGGSSTVVLFGSLGFVIHKFENLNASIRVIGIILFTALYLTISNSPVIRIGRN